MEDPQLVGRGHAREYSRVFDSRVQSCVLQFIQLIAGDHRVSRPVNVQFPSNGKRSNLVIAGDHDRADTGLAACAYRISNLFPGRIDHARYSEEGHIVFHIVAVLLRNLFAGQGTRGKAQHAQSLLRHGQAKAQNVCTVASCDGADSISRQYMGAQRQHFIYGAFCIGNPVSRDHMYCRHTFAVGIERLLKPAGICVLQGLMIDSESLSHVNQRALCRIADDCACVIRVDARIIAQRRRVNKLLINNGVLSGGFGDGGGRARFKIAVYRDVSHSHLIERQRPCLIAANDSGAAKRFHSGQIAYKRIAFSHALHAQGHYNGRRSWQTFRNDGNCQGNSNEKLRDQWTLIERADQKDHYTDNQTDNGERFTNCIQLAFKRRVKLILLLQHFSNAADLRIHAGCHHNAGRTAVGDNRGRIHHIAPVAQRAIQREQIVGVLFRGDGFSGQGGFLHL